MPPSRFANVSPYKNLVAIPAKREQWFSELPASVSCTDASDGLAATSKYWIAKGSTTGSLICLPWGATGKRAKKAPLLSTVRGISDFTTSPFDDLLAVGSERGETQVLALPEIVDPTATVIGLNPPANLHPTSGLSHRPVDRLAFHPTSSSLLASSSGDSVAIFDASASAEAIAIPLNCEKGVWDLKWSWDGKFLAASVRNGQTLFCDPRASRSAVAAVKPHENIGKASRITWAGSALLTTGFSRMQEREYNIFDPRNLGAGAIMTGRVNAGGSTGVLIPVVDDARRIIYLAGRSDTTLRWLDLSSPDPLELKPSSFVGSYNAPLPVPIAGFTRAPVNPDTVDPMKAELSRLVVLGKGGEVVPVIMQAPKRQYIDFHADVMPAVRSMAPAQGAAAWLDGEDNQVDLVSQDPAEARRPSVSVTTTIPADLKSPLPSESKSGLDTQGTPETSFDDVRGRPIQLLADARTVERGRSNLPTASATAPSPPSIGRDLSATPTSAPQQLHSLTPGPLPTTGAASYGVRPRGESPPEARPVTTARSAPGAERWSRKFLSGKTPLKADYDSLHNLATTYASEKPLIKGSPRAFYFPLGGPGGRLGVHLAKKKGRLPFKVPCFVSGGDIIDFDIDPFDEGRVFVATEDGKIRAFGVPEEGIEGDVLQYSVLLEDPKLDRISAVTAHPTARDILATISDDKGTPTLRVWDVGQRSVAVKIGLLGGGAPMSAAWSPDGSRIAIASKSNKLSVLDPRNPESIVAGGAHESPRAVHVAWADGEHLLTTGFARSASREVALHRVSPKGIECLALMTYDVSPAPFFPHFDPDTSILYLWSKGERTLFPCEVHPDLGAKAFEPLPPFAHSTLQTGWTFLPKRVVDVQRVEIARAWRLTPSSVETVSFTIPRARVEFFQDDVFPPTPNTAQPSLSASQWLSGDNKELERFDLRPSGMKLLSEAPMTTRQTNQRDMIAKGPQPTDSQKQEQYLNRLFSAAQTQGGRSTGNYAGAHRAEKEDSDEERVGRSRVGAPVDDDDDW